MKSAHLKKQGLTTVNTRVQKAAPENGGADLLAAAEAMKPMVEQIGADKVKRIVGLLHRSWSRR